MRKFFESEILIDCITDCKNKLQLDINIQEFLNQLKLGNADALNDILLNIIDDEKFNEISFDDNSVLPPMGEKGFGLRFRKTIKDEKVQTLRFIKVNDTIESSSLSILALLITIIILSPTGVVPSLGICKAIWQNIVTLKRSKFPEAIDTYEEILKICTEKKWEQISTSNLISNSNLNQNNIFIGLTVLTNLSLVKNMKWGGKAFDFNNFNNIWSLTY